MPHIDDLLGVAALATLGWTGALCLQDALPSVAVASSFLAPIRVHAAAAPAAPASSLEAA